MKRPPSVIGQLIRFAAPLALAAPLAAQTPATPTLPATPAVTTPATAVTTGTTPTTKPITPTQAVIDLPRLKSRGKPSAELPRLAKTKVTVDELAPQLALGAKSLVKQNLNYLTLEANKEWSRPLRGAPKDTTFVSFLAYASEGTVIDIGGAKITIKPSSKAGYAQISVPSPAAGSSSPPYGNLIKIEKHDGASLAALPVFTVRLDPAAGVWDLYVFQRLVAEDLPLADVKGARQFAIKPGAQGAQVLGLVTSDENPLFVDANANGIDDTFEKQKRNGALLAANAPAAERIQLAQQWKDSQGAADVKPWKIRRPVPDNVVAVATPK